MANSGKIRLLKDIQKRITQAQRRAAAGRSRHKSHGVIHTRGCIFSHDAQNEFSLFPSF